MNNALTIVRRADIWVSTQKAALMVGKSMRWVQENKMLFRFQMKGSRNLVFELASVLKVAQSLEQRKNVA